MGKRIAILVEPLDVLFFRDGRPFEAGMRASGGLPLPQTLAGAIRSCLWGRLDLDFSKMTDAVGKHGSVEAAAEALLGPNKWAARVSTAGPWLWSAGGERADSIPKGPLVPVPSDLVREGKVDEHGRLIRLRPSKAAPPGWVPPREGMMPLWHRNEGTVDKAHGFLAAPGLAAYLNGEAPGGDGVVSEDRLVAWEDRTGVGIDMDRNRAEDHMLYSVRFLRLRPGVSFYAEVVLPDGAPADAAKLIDGAVVPFGGEGRQARISAAGEHSWPAPSQKGDGELALLVTPGVFSGAEPWMPDCKGLPRLLSAAVPGSIAISGWDMARRQPKPVRNAVLAGAAYLFFGGGSCQKEGPFVRLSRDAELNALGYGLALKGVWNHG